MKKIFAILIALMLVFCLPLSAFAAEGEEVPTPSEEIATEGEISAKEKPITEVIVEWVQAHISDISVVATLCLTIVYEIRKHKQLRGSIGTLNNNAITIAENSATAIQSALSGVEGVANVVNEYKDEFASVLAEIRHNAEEKKKLEDTLNNIETFLKTVKLATLEMSNEVAELLILANIPNSKKDELYARHKKAVHDLEIVEEEGKDGNTEG